MSETTKELIIAAVKSFPAMSPAAMQVLKLLGDPDTNLADIRNAVRYDPGLTANILRMANSAYFGFPGTIGSIGQAVARLGWKRMFQLVIASTVYGLMEKPVSGYSLPPGELWRHSVAASGTAELIVKNYKIRVSDDTFTSALLHDVGKIVLGDVAEAYFDEIETAALQGRSFEAAERDVLGTDHAEVGAWILEHWSLPGDLVNAVRWHHNPDGAGATSPELDVVHVADVLSHSIGTGVGRDDMKYHPSVTAMQRLGLQPDDLESIACQILQGSEDLQQAFKPAFTET